MQSVYIAFIFLLLCSVVSQAGVFRWVDANGRVHYSDEIPPSAAQGGHAELDQAGITVKTVAAAPTPEQIAERQQQALEEKLRASVTDEQQKHDQYLLANYTDTEELEATFKSKLELLDKSTDLMKGRIAKLEQALIDNKLQLQGAKGEIKRKKLEAFIQESEENLKDYNQILKSNKEEREELAKSHDADKKRLQELLSASPSSPPPDPLATPAVPHEEPARQ